VKGAPFVHVRLQLVFLQRMQIMDNNE